MVELDELRHIGIACSLPPLAHRSCALPVLLLFDRAAKMLRAFGIHLSSGS